MMKNEMRTMGACFGDFVSVEELKETMTGASRYAWNAIQKHMCNEEHCRFPKFMEAVWEISNEDVELAYNLICIMLEEAEEHDFLSLLEVVCEDEYFATCCFVDGFNEPFDCYLEDKGVIDENEDNDGDFDEEFDMKDPVMEISIKMNQDLMPMFQKQMNDFFQMLGISFPGFVKEAEEDE